MSPVPEQGASVPFSLSVRRAINTSGMIFHLMAAPSLNSALASKSQMIEYENVTKIFRTRGGTVTAADEINLSIETGRLVVLLGPSGCGKTTLLRMTNRLEPLTSGTIRVKGRNIMDMEPVKLRQQMGYVIQQIGLFPNKTVAQNIAVVPRLLGWNKRRIDRRTEELLELIRLEPRLFRDRYPVELSGGQQQRVGVARALAADPDILLMDEPFGSLDPINRAQIQEEFLNLQAALGKTIAFVSHDIHEAIKMADKIAVFNEGRLIQYDPPELILTRPFSHFVSSFIGADRALNVLALLKAEEAMQRAPENIVAGSTPASETQTLMEQKGFRLVVVLSDGRPAGYATSSMLKTAEGATIDAAENLPFVVREKDSLKYVLSSMLMYDMDTFCVVGDNGELAGTISYREIHKRLLTSYKDSRDDETPNTACATGLKTFPEPN